MNDELTLVDITTQNINEYSLCGYKSSENPCLANKREWLLERLGEGYVYRLLVDQEGNAVGGIEFGPADSAWRPIQAPGYYFIHCLCIIVKKYKNTGWGLKLLQSVLDTCRSRQCAGVAVVARKGTWMAGPELFLKAGFSIADKASPDFSLLAYSFSEDSQKPVFIDNSDSLQTQYGSGLTILTSSQCPYLIKSVPEIVDAARELFQFEPNVIELSTAADARRNPSPYGVFTVLYEGRIILDSPASKTRFVNVMKKEVSRKS